LVPDPEEVDLVYAITLIRILSSLYSLALVGTVFLSMLLGPYHSVVAFLRRITEPLLAPIRRRIPPIRSGNMAWDLSPMVAVILVWVAESALVLLLRGLAS